jgi:CHAD domain-containing protein
MMAASAVQGKPAGLAHWMQQVLEQSEKVAAEGGADAVHDLRTALRRCRSLADGMMVFDLDPAWKKMKKQGKQLFVSLGELRDSYVMSSWIAALAPESDLARKALAGFLAQQQPRLRSAAALALQNFDRKQWVRWTEELPRRVERIPLDSPAFAHLALERCELARVLHRQALRNRTNIAFHRLRISLKRFRYTLENFSPSLHEVWGQDLKQLQDLLGEVHDLDVLWQSAVCSKAFPDENARTRWRRAIEQERHERLNAYRRKMVGPDSLWKVWRDGLPGSQQVRSLALQRLEIWASFLDPDIHHAQHTARLALQLYDGLLLAGALRSTQRRFDRDILEAAAYMHDVGRSRIKKAHHKASARLIRKLVVPLGWTARDLRMAALVARYHRGALPNTQARFKALPESKQRAIELLGGILRFACACDGQGDGQIRRIKVESSLPVLIIRLEGYREYAAAAEHLAARRHLLELACRRPILVSPLGGSK